MMVFGRLIIRNKTTLAVVWEIHSVMPCETNNNAMETNDSRCNVFLVARVDVWVCVVCIQRGWMSQQVCVCVCGLRMMGRLFHNSPGTTSTNKPTSISSVRRHGAHKTARNNAPCVVVQGSNSGGDSIGAQLKPRMKTVIRRRERATARASRGIGATSSDSIALRVGPGGGKGK